MSEKCMLKVNELFAGIGAFREALIRTGIPHKIVGISEIDKYAIKSYEAIYGKTKNYGDISKVDKLDYADLWTYGFPCQDISVAGKQAGIEKGKTRSGLLYEVERLLEKSKECGELPKYLMLENVKNLVGKKFKPQFEEWLQKLDELGYNSYWQVLNAKNYGVPQNRERVFVISIRKDIDTGYEFPVGFDNGKRLKDILESEVDEKYYISDRKTEGFIEKILEKNQEVSYCIDANYWKGTTPEQFIKKSRRQLVVVEQKKLKALIPQATKQGCIECNIPGVADLSFPDSKTRRGGVQENGEICPTLTAENPTEQRLEVNKNGTSNTITTVQKDNYVLEPKFRIRKLTPLECWRLMGFADNQFYKAESVNSNSQLYKQAGNSIVVNVLEAIIGNLLVEERSDWLDTLLD